MIEKYTDRILSVPDFKNNIKAGPTHDTTHFENAIYELIKNDANGIVTFDEFSSSLNNIPVQDKPLVDTDKDGIVSPKEKYEAWVNALSIANPNEIFEPKTEEPNTEEPNTEKPKREWYEW